MSALPSIAFLGFLAVVSILLSLRRRSPDQATGERRASASTLAVTTAIQTVHFTEEWVTGFAVAFPALFGLPPMPAMGFALFNISCIVGWALACFGVMKGSRVAYAAAWFLAFAALLNGVAHPGMAVFVGGYFPGLLTSPLIGIVGGVLAVKLWRSTSSS